MTTWWLTIGLIIEALFIWELWSRFKGESARVTKLAEAFYLHLRDDHQKEFDYIRYPEAIGLDDKYPQAPIDLDEFK